MRNAAVWSVFLFFCLDCFWGVHAPLSCRLIHWHLTQYVEWFWFHSSVQYYISFLFQMWIMVKAGKQLINVILPCPMNRKVVDWEGGKNKPQTHLLCFLLQLSPRVSEGFCAPTMSILKISQVYLPKILCAFCSRCSNPRSLSQFLKVLPWGCNTFWIGTMARTFLKSGKASSWHLSQWMISRSLFLRRLMKENLNLMAEDGSSRNNIQLCWDTLWISEEWWIFHFYLLLSFLKPFLFYYIFFLYLLLSIFSSFVCYLFPVFLHSFFLSIRSFFLTIFIFCLFFPSYFPFFLSTVFFLLSVRSFQILQFLSGISSVCAFIPIFLFSFLQSFFLISPVFPSHFLHSLITSR